MVRLDCAYPVLDCLWVSFSILVVSLCDFSSWLGRCDTLLRLYSQSSFIVECAAKESNSYARSQMLLEDGPGAAKAIGLVSTAGGFVTRCCCAGGCLHHTGDEVYNCSAAYWRTTGIETGSKPCFVHILSSTSTICPCYGTKPLSLVKGHNSSRPGQKQSVILLIVKTSNH